MFSGIFVSHSLFRSICVSSSCISSMWEGVWSAPHTNTRPERAAATTATWATVTAEKDPATRTSPFSNSRGRNTLTATHTLLSCKHTHTKVEDFLVNLEEAVPSSVIDCCAANQEHSKVTSLTQCDNFKLHIQLKRVFCKELNFLICLAAVKWAVFKFLRRIDVINYSSSCLFQRETRSQHFGAFLKKSLKPINMLLLISVKTCTPIKWTHGKLFFEKLEDCSHISFWGTTWPGTRLYITNAFGLWSRKTTKILN